MVNTTAPAVNFPAVRQEDAPRSLSVSIIRSATRHRQWQGKTGASERCLHGLLVEGCGPPE